MWLPTPVYERIPQFYFLVGLLFITNGLYLGLDYAIAFYYIGFGFISCAYGVAIFLMRRLNRQGRTAVQNSAPMRDAPAPVEESASSADESVADSSHEHSVQH